MRGLKYRTAGLEGDERGLYDPVPAASPTAYRLLRLLLLAVDPFLHGSVPEALEFDEFAALEGAHIGFGRGFSASGDLAEDDHDIIIVVGGEETTGPLL